MYEYDEALSVLAADADTEAKLEAIRVLASKRTGKATAVLLEALSDGNWSVRKAASEALASFGTGVMDPLGRVLASGNEDQRFWAVKTLVAIGRESLPLLCRALSGGGKLMRIYAASALGEIGDASALPLLVKALGDPVWRVRRNAFEALVSFGEKALPYLREAMASDNEDVVYWAARTLGKIGEPSRDILLEALRTGSEQNRFIVAAALAETGDRRIIAVLVKNCGEGNWLLQKRSADALAEIGRPAVPAIVDGLKKARGRKLYWLLYALARMERLGRETLVKVLTHGGEAFRWDVKEHLIEIGEPVVPVFVTLAGSDDRNVRFFAVTCLGEASRSALSDDVLMRALKDSSWSIRRTAADALASRGAAVLDRLNLALGAGDEDLRFWVTYIFRKMGSTGIEYLVRALGDSNKNIAYFAAAALGDVQDESVVKPLVAALADEYWPLRRSAAESLERLARFSVPVLIRHVNDENADVQYWAGRILARVGGEHLDEIVRLLRKGNDEERFFAAKALGSIRDPRAVEPLIEALSDGHEWVRLYAAIALGHIGDPRALSHLVDMLGDSGVKVGSSIYGVFDEFGEASVPLLLEAARSGDGNLRRKCAALVILGRLGCREAVDMVVEALGSKDEDLVIAGAEAAGGLGGDPAVTAALQEALNGATALSRRKIVQALSRIGGTGVVEAMLQAVSVGDDDRVTRDPALKALAGMGPEVVSELVRMLSHDKVAIRKAAAKALVAIGPRCRSLVESVAGSSDGNVRFWAAKVLKAIDSMEGDERA